MTNERRFQTGCEAKDEGCLDSAPGSEQHVYVNWGSPPMRMCMACYAHLIKGCSLKRIQDRQVKKLTNPEMPKLNNKPFQRALGSK